LMSSFRSEASYAAHVRERQGCYDVDAALRGSLKVQVDASVSMAGAKRGCGGGNSGWDRFDPPRPSTACKRRGSICSSPRDRGRDVTKPCGAVVHSLLPEPVGFSTGSPSPGGLRDLRVLRRTRRPRASSIGRALSRSRPQAAPTAHLYPPRDIRRLGSGRGGSSSRRGGVQG
jgi:hypothetical protein